MYIAILTQCLLNENQCPNQEIHMLFEHGSELEKSHQVICMTLYTESFVDQTDNFTDAFVRENLVYGYDVTFESLQSMSFC